MKYSMIGTGQGHDPEFWIIYETSKGYIKGEMVRMPRGSKVQEEAAQKVLEAMNS